MDKILQIVKNNALKLNAVLNNQEKFEIMMNDHNNKISELRNKVEYRTEVDPVESRKGKGVVKGEKNEFYHVNTYDTIIVFTLQYIFMSFLILIIA